MSSSPEANALFQLEIERLRAGIRKHRDYRGDDRCHEDDDELYAILPEGWTPRKRDTAVTLENCKRFIACRQNPATTYVSPEREIERLRAALDQIANPIAYLQKLAQAEGKVIDPNWALRYAESTSSMREIARAALDYEGE